MLAPGRAGSGLGSGAKAVASPTRPDWSGKTGTLVDPPGDAPTEVLPDPRLLVVDTNVALKAYLEEDLSDEAGAILDAGLSGEATLVAPSLILPEFRHALDKRRRRAELSSEEAEEIWSEFGSYPVVLYDLEPLMSAAVGIVRRSGCTAYDALFVALAEAKRAEGAAFVTADDRLTKALDGSPYAYLILPLGKATELL